MGKSQLLEFNLSKKNSKIKSNTIKIRIKMVKIEIPCVIIEQIYEML